MKEFQTIEMFREANKTRVQIKKFGGGKEMNHYFSGEQRIV